LTGAGLIRRAVDQGPPIAVTYHATESAKALVPALAALIRWASTDLPESARCPGAQAALTGSSDVEGEVVEHE
jgi:DNA-binding HxlR family transcriptional regulator